MTPPTRHRLGAGALVFVLALLVAWWFLGPGDGLSPPLEAARDVAPTPRVEPPPTVIELPTEDGASTARIAAIEIDTQAPCIGGNVQYAVRLSSDDHRLVPRVGFGARMGRGAVGVARQYSSRQEAGEDMLNVHLVDAITGELHDSRTVPVDFVTCGEDEPQDVLRLVCQPQTSRARADCRVVEDLGELEVEWELWAAYPDRQGPSTTALGRAVTLELPVHEGEGSTETYMVTATAVTLDGALLTGRTSFTRSRRGYKQRVLHGELLLWSQQLGPSQHLLTNTAAEDLLLETTLTIEHRPCAPDGVPHTAAIATQDVLGDPRIAAHERRALDWTPPRDPDVCGYRILFEGVGDRSGDRVIGAFRAK